MTKFWKNLGKQMLVKHLENWGNLKIFLENYRKKRWNLKMLLKHNENRKFENVRKMQG